MNNIEILKKMQSAKNCIEMIATQLDHLDGTGKRDVAHWLKRSPECKELCKYCYEFHKMLYTHEQKIAMKRKEELGDMEVSE